MYGMDFVALCVCIHTDSRTTACPVGTQMWRYEGSRTLAYYLRRRDTLRALAADMDVPVEACPAIIMKQILQGLVVSVGCVQSALTARNI